MADIFLRDQPFQGSSSPTRFVDYFETGGVYQGSSQACIVDLIPPTFAGIIDLHVQSRGQLRATWAAGTDVTLPVRYEIYIKPTNATGLFNAANLIALTDKLLFDIFVLPDGSFLQNGVAYYVGVRAIDGVGNRDSNTISMSVISTGILTTVDSYKVEGAFAVGTNNMFQGTMWILKDSVLGLGATLGPGSYQVYDKAGNPVAGMSESGIVADANGQYKITPVVSNLLQSLSHYVVKVTIMMDSEYRTSYVPLIEPIPTYEVDASYSIDESSQLRAAFWANVDGQLITDLTRLGNASYAMYDRVGNLIPTLAEVGLTPSATGLYHITPVPGISPQDLIGHNGKITIIIDGIARSNFIPTIPINSNYETKGQFSINASNQFKATFWAVKNGLLYPSGPSLGTATYTVYDAAGIAVAGLTESGIVADVNGYFHITPVSAILLTDLTHYTVEISISVDGSARKSVKGFTLLGT